MEDWRLRGRWDALRLLERETRRAKWSPALIRVLLEELFVEEEFVHLLGDPDRLRPNRYPQAIAVALALRHSWRPDDFHQLTSRLFTRDHRRHVAAMQRRAAPTDHRRHH